MRQGRGLRFRVGLTATTSPVGVGVQKQGAEEMGTRAVGTDVRDAETAEIVTAGVRKC